MTVMERKMEMELSIGATVFALACKTKTTLDEDSRKCVDAAQAMLDAAATLEIIKNRNAAIGEWQVLKYQIEEGGADDDIEED